MFYPCSWSFVFQSFSALQPKSISVSNYKDIRIPFPTTMLNPTWSGFITWRCYELYLHQLFTSPCPPVVSWFIASMKLWFITLDRSITKPPYTGTKTLQMKDYGTTLERHLPWHLSIIDHVLQGIPHWWLAKLLCHF